MSIAEQIMLGTQQQSKNWSVLSENLGRLGQQVGQQLAMREYQKQAAEALPAMQAAYRSAMDDVSRGSVSEGYKKFMDAQFQFGGSQNPFISNQNKLVSEIFMEGAAAYEKQQQRQAQYGGGGPVYEVPSLDELRSGDTIPTTTVLPVMEAGMEEGGQPDGQPEAYLNPLADQPLQGTPEQRAQQAAAQREMLDQEAAANLPKQEPSQGENPFDVGFKTGSVSRYVAPEKYRKMATDAFITAVKATPDQRKATIKSITEDTEVIPENAYRGNIPGFGDGYIVGPSMEVRQEVKERQVKEKFTGEGREAERTDKMGPAELTEAQQTFKEFTRTMGVASGMFRYNKQLAEIMEAAGGDPTKIQIQEEEEETEDGKMRKVNRAFVNDQDLGILSEERPLGEDGKPDPRYLSEAGAVRTMITAPDMIASFGGKFIPIKKPAAAQPAAAGGLPAVQAQAPAAPKIPAEAEGLYKQLGAIEAQEEKISSSEKQNRIKQINKEIESLQKTTRVSSPSYAPAMGVPYSKIPQKKSAAEIKQAITKIEQLVSERDKLEGKTTGKKISPMDQQALDWANANSNDPRARAIKQKLGM